MSCLSAYGHKTELHHNPEQIMAKKPPPLVMPVSFLACHMGDNKNKDIVNWSFGSFFFYAIQ